MIRGTPLIPTVIVSAAVATMIALGVWQLGRAEWKAKLLENYAAADAMPAAVFPRSAGDVEVALYRRSQLYCDRVLSRNAIAGKSARGASGLAVVARCALDGGGEADVVIGFSKEPVLGDWAGGAVAGMIGPGRDGEARLIAEPAITGLEESALPDPSDIPNNHLAYAGQWFFFALTALIIYIIALRRRAQV